MLPDLLSSFLLFVAGYWQGLTMCLGFWRFIYCPRCLYSCWF